VVVNEEIRVGLYTGDRETVGPTRPIRQEIAG
jgi:hypothetical protein